MGSDAIIATMPVTGIVPDVVDDHYYKRQQGMFELVKHYDEMDRKGPKIFVGEWATREGTLFRSRLVIRSEIAAPPPDVPALVS